MHKHKRSKEIVRKRKTLEDIFFTDLVFVGLRCHSSSKGSTSFFLVSFEKPSLLSKLLPPLRLLPPLWLLPPLLLLPLLLPGVLLSRRPVAVVVVVVVMTSTFGT